MSYIWTAQQGLTGDEYQQYYDEYTALGYRPAQVSGYGVDGAARYAAVWQNRSGPARVARHGLTGAEYQRRFDEYASSGYRLASVSGYGVDGEVRYAAIWEQDSGTDWVAHHGLTGDEYQRHFDEYTDRGYRPTQVSGYGVDGEARYAAVWERRPGPAWVARHDLTTAQYRRHLDDYADRHQLVDVSGYTVDGEVRYAAVWERRSGPDRIAHWALTPAEYRRHFDEYPAQGYRLADVSGYGVDGAARYAAIWKMDPDASLAASPERDLWETRTYELHDFRVTPYRWDGEPNGNLELYGRIEVRPVHDEQEYDDAVVWERERKSPVTVPGGQTTRLTLNEVEGSEYSTTVTFHNELGRPWSEYKTDASIQVWAGFTEHDPVLDDDPLYGSLDEWGQREEFGDVATWNLTDSPGRTPTTKHTHGMNKNALEFDFAVRPL